MKSRKAEQRLESVYLTAPVGGTNTVDPASEMPKNDAVYVHNMVSGELGDLVRHGFQEWATGVTGGIDNSMRSMLPYGGSTKNGSQDKMFGVSQTGIWDLTNSTQAPTQVLAFASPAGDAGYGISHAFTTPGDHFLVYCDEVNGLFVYTQSTGLWTAVPAGCTAPWATSTVIAAGTQVINAGNQYVCASITTGVTAPSGAGPTTTAAGIVDGGVVWNYVGAAPTKCIGPSIADQNLGRTGLPTNFAFVMAWGSRLWFVERDTTLSWYLSVNSMFGTAQALDWGIKMPHGGPLVGMYGWSYDGGSGMKTELVGISGAGDVVIYEGTDPNSASTFALRGAWFCGGVPYGRRVAIEFGGEVLILSLLGALPLSKLVTGASIMDRAQFATAKIHNLFNLLAQTYKTLPGWSIHMHPQDNCLLITVPQPLGYTPLQLAMSLATKSWSDFRGLPILSACVWNGQFYFGTPDGRACISQGYVDNVTLANPNVYTPVFYSLLHAFRNAGTMKNKLVRFIRPDILSNVATPGIQAVAKYNYDTTEPADTSSSGGGGAQSWDVATWDAATWAGDYTPFGQVIGATGMGRAVSVAIRGQAISRTIYVGCDVAFEQAGVL